MDERVGEGKTGELPLTPDQGERVLRRVAWRLLPFMGLMYLLAYIDRVNVGFASLHMTGDLGFSDAVYGLGTGIFFIGYFLFEVPSNLILHRMGPRRWIARIMITWGLVAIGMMFVRGTASFYGMRFLLGLAEAGFFPGMLLYLSYWFPARYRARTGAIFLTASAVAGIVGGPLSGALLELNGLGGLHGWQWLFLIEGIPSVAVGVVAFFYLTDRPAKARWLTTAEAEWVEGEIERDFTDRRETSPSHLRFVDALKDYRLWVLTAVFFTVPMGGYASTYWMPKVLKEVSALSDTKVGLLSAIPWCVAVTSMLLVGRHSDRHGERRWHVALSLVVAALGLMWTPFCTSPLTAVIAFSMALSGIWCSLAPFWAIPGEFLRGPAAAGGIAIINSVGNLGGFLGPYVVGFVRARSNGFNGGLVAVAFGVLAGATLVILGVRKPAKEPRGFEVIAK